MIATDGQARLNAYLAEGKGNHATKSRQTEEGFLDLMAHLHRCTDSEACGLRSQAEGGGGGEGGSKKEWAQARNGRLGYPQGSGTVTRTQQSLAVLFDNGSESVRQRVIAMKRRKSREFSRWDRVVEVRQGETFRNVMERENKPNPRKLGKVPLFLFLFYFFQLVYLSASRYRTNKQRKRKDCDCFLFLGR
ncbi:hypothetical protein F4815DRAFT_304700 [Daldinia loculata]|nr:hypothetical protein F4815DRAFT_304700 [Daldinia loculata]